VLAVGDAEFQKKCLGKMSDVAGEGRTVLFVSHNVVAVQHLCSRAILLNSGTLETIGNAYQVVNQYTYTASSRNTIDSLVHAPRVGKGDVKFNSITFLDEHNRPLSSLLCGDPLNIRLDIGNHNDIHNVRVSIDFVDSLGQTVTILDGAYVGIIKYLPANSSIYFYIPKLQLVPGTYGLTLYLQAPIGVVQDWLTQAIFIEVLEGDYYKSGKAVKSGSQVFVSDFELRATE
jgi:lipopolysaccharide transport system ATP-binding protein